MVPVGQDLIVKDDHQQGEQGRGRKDWAQQQEEAHATGFGGDDFAVGGQPGEGHQHGDEHGHRHRERDDPGQVEHQQLASCQRGQAFA